MAADKGHARTLGADMGDHAIQTPHPHDRASQVGESQFN
jgi:hypothetical protein